MLRPWQFLQNAQEWGKLACRGLAGRPLLPMTEDDIVAAYSPLPAAPLEAPDVAADTLNGALEFRATAFLAMGTGQDGPHDVRGVALTYDGHPFAVRMWDWPFTIDSLHRVLKVPIKLTVTAGSADAA